MASRCRSLQDRLTVWLPPDVAAELAQCAPGVQHWGGTWKAAADVGTSEAQDDDSGDDDDDAEGDAGDEGAPPNV